MRTERLRSGAFSTAEDDLTSRGSRLALNLLLAMSSFVVAFAGLEVVLRIRHGGLLDFSSQLDPVPNRADTPLADYDPRLGWVPKPGEFDRSPTEKWTIDEHGLRSNGLPSPQADRRILAVGDSYTFGDEVMDVETWPARLEARLGAPVVNGGVFAYGIDQAGLRAELLIDELRPSVVILAFISDDINRAELSFYNGWKPYFELADGALTLENVPVPTGVLPRAPFATLRSTLSYSYVFSAILRRVAERWWSYGRAVRVHTDGERVAVELLARVSGKAEQAGGRLVVVALPSHVGGRGRSARIVEQARARGIDVLDLLPMVESLAPDSAAALFRTRGHYTPAMNDEVARRIGEHLREAK